MARVARATVARMPIDLLRTRIYTAYAYIYHVRALLRSAKDESTLPGLIRRPASV